MRKYGAGLDKLFGFLSGYFEWGIDFYETQAMRYVEVLKEVWEVLAFEQGMVSEQSSQGRVWPILHNKYCIIRYSSLG